MRASNLLALGTKVRKVISWILLPVGTLAIFLGISWLSLALNVNTALADTRSQLQADYSPGELLTFYPISPGILDEIRRDTGRSAGEGGHTDPQSSPGWFWDEPNPTPNPEISITLTSDSPTAEMSQTPTRSETATSTSSPTASTTPTGTATDQPTATPTLAGPPVPIAPPSTPTNDFWFYDDSNPIAFMMYAAPGNSSYQSSTAPVSFFTAKFASNQALLSGTTKINFYASNNSSTALNFTAALYAGVTELGSGMFTLPPTGNTAPYFTASFATAAHSFSSGDRIELRFSLAAPLEIFWDGPYNISGVDVPALLTLPTATPSQTPTSTLTPTVPPTSAPTATPTPTTSYITGAFWLYDDTSPIAYMMYQSQPGGENRNSSADVDFYAGILSGHTLLAGTTTIHFSATNAAGEPLAVNFELLAGQEGVWQSLGTGSSSIPGDTSEPTLFSTSFSTLGTTFAEGGRLRLSVQLSEPHVFYWDGAFNDSRVVIPGG
jgi:hypothetical protein